MTIGQRIKFIRKFRGMTQKELGEMLGFEEHGDVRIAQYESDARTPKKPIVDKLAKSLCVSSSALSPTLCNSRKDFMQSIFWIEEMKGGGDIYDCIAEWTTMKTKYEKGEISKQEYLEWKLTY